MNPSILAALFASSVALTSTHVEAQAPDALLGKWTIEFERGRRMENGEATIMMGTGKVTIRADWSFRDDMYGEPSSDPGRFTFIDSRDLINFDISYRPNDGDWTVAAYGRNVTDERYDNARLNVTDYVLIMMSNDASEFGVRFTKEF
jgi:hypothetical protein